MRHADEASWVMSDDRNLLPQTLGWAPGTSLIGSFGSTDTRFKRIPMDNSPEPFNPGPGAYASRISSLAEHASQASAAKWSIHGGNGHNPPVTQTRTPGPGAYGAEQHPLGGIMTGLRRKWPGIVTKSSFGSNAELPTLRKMEDDGKPGPGKYNMEESSYFTSAAPGGSRSPFPSQARAITGSRLQRDVDVKTGANFISKSAAHQLPFNGQKDGPGPSQYAPNFDSIDERAGSTMRGMALRSDGGACSSFHHTQARFSESAEVSQQNLPGPGAHTVARWTGEQPSSRRPRSLPRSQQGGNCGFLTSAERFSGPRGHESSKDAVLNYLAYGDAGPIGLPTHAQAARRSVAEARRAEYER